VTAFEIPAGSSQRLKRIKQLLPKSRDPVLVVLKCHLLIEEQLERLIESRLRDDRALPDLRLRFEQKLKLASALFGRALSYQEPVKKLNAIRNKLAHNLDGYDISSLLNEVLRSADPDSYESLAVAQASLRRRLTYLKNLLSSCVLSGRAMPLKVHRNPSVGARPSNRVAGGV
jgi:hypothetical protein